MKIKSDILIKSKEILISIERKVSENIGKPVNNKI